MDPLTSWTLIAVIGVPWVVGVVTMVSALSRRMARLDREEPLYVEPRTVERLGGDR